MKKSLISGLECACWRYLMVIVPSFNGVILYQETKMYIINLKKLLKCKSAATRIENSQATLKYINGKRKLFVIC